MTSSSPFFDHKNLSSSSSYYEKKEKLGKEGSFLYVVCLSLDVSLHTADTGNIMREPM